MPSASGRGDPSGPHNIHATTIALGECGILITGPSQSGKSALAAFLCRAAARPNRFAALVADDRTVLTRHGDNLIARCPARLAGRIEVFGVGIVPIASIGAVRLALEVALVAPGAAPRMPCGDVTRWLGVPLPLLRTASDDLHRAITAIEAKLCA